MPHPGSIAASAFTAPTSLLDLGAEVARATPGESIGEFGSVLQGFAAGEAPATIEPPVAIETPSVVEFAGESSVSRRDGADSEAMIEPGRDAVIDAPASEAGESEMPLARFMASLPSNSFDRAEAPRLSGDLKNRGRPSFGPLGEFPVDNRLLKQSMSAPMGSPVSQGLNEIEGKPTAATSRTASSTVISTSGTDSGTLRFELAAAQAAASLPGATPPLASAHSTTILATTNSVAMPLVLTSPVSTQITASGDPHGLVQALPVSGLAGSEKSEAVDKVATDVTPRGDVGVARGDHRQGHVDRQAAAIRSDSIESSSILRTTYTLVSTESPDRTPLPTSAAPTVVVESSHPSTTITLDRVPDDAAAESGVPAHTHPNEEEIAGPSDTIVSSFRRISRSDPSAHLETPERTPETWRQDDSIDPKGIGAQRSVNAPVLSDFSPSDVGRSSASEFVDDIPLQVVDRTNTSEISSEQRQLASMERVYESQRKPLVSLDWVSSGRRLPSNLEEDAPRTAAAPAQAQPRPSSVPTSLVPTRADIDGSAVGLASAKKLPNDAVVAAAGEANASAGIVEGGRAISPRQSGSESGYVISASPVSAATTTLQPRAERVPESGGGGGAKVTPSQTLLSVPWATNADRVAPEVANPTKPRPHVVSSTRQAPEPDAPQSRRDASKSPISKDTAVRDVPNSAPRTLTTGITEGLSVDRLGGVSGSRPSQILMTPLPSTSEPLPPIGSNLSASVVSAQPAAASAAQSVGAQVAAALPQTTPSRGALGRVALSGEVTISTVTAGAAKRVAAEPQPVSGGASGSVPAAVVVAREVNATVQPSPSAPQPAVFEAMRYETLRRAPGSKDVIARPQVIDFTPMAVLPAATPATAGVPQGVMIPESPTAASSVGTPATPMQIDFKSEAWEENLAELVSGLSAMEEDNITVVRLSPEHLGELEIGVTIKEGEVNVAFAAQVADTRVALEQALPRLRELMGQSGLELANAGVYSNLPGGTERQQERFAEAVMPQHMNEANESAEEPVQQSSRTPQGAVDLYA